MKLFTSAFLFLTIFWAFPAKAITSEPANAPSTLNSLMTAYSRASNEKLTYLVYAVKADQEGYKMVAQIFRTASKSEGISAGLFAKSVIKLGGTPAYEKKVPEAKTTQENIQEAIDIDSNEVDKVFPKFIARAEAEKQDEVKHLFNTAMLVKSNQLGILKDILGEPKTWKNPARARFACESCGNMNDTANATNCPICGAYVGDYRGSSKHP